MTATNNAINLFFHQQSTTKFQQCLHYLVQANKAPANNEFTYAIWNKSTSAARM